jgi:uncharacterized protein GlcG (DUF336 family)
MTNFTHAVSTHQITHLSAMIATNAALDKATALGIHVSVAIVNSSTQLVSFVHMNNAFQLSSDLAQKKSRCAASLGFSADVIEQVLADEQPRVGAGLISHPDFTEIRGGLPLYENGILIGAIGVSGGTEAQDIECATAGLNKLELSQQP